MGFGLSVLVRTSPYLLTDSQQVSLDDHLDLCYFVHYIGGLAETLHTPLAEQACLVFPLWSLLHSKLPRARYRRHETLRCRSETAFNVWSSAKAADKEIVLFVIITV